MIVKDINALAVRVARECKWCGDDIVAVMLEALTEANFHTLREQLEQLTETYFEGESK